jgi:hypothetical protein
MEKKPPEKPSQADIQKKAYELWEKEGKKPHLDKHYWYLAEAELKKKK